MPCRTVPTRCRQSAMQVRRIAAAPHSREEAEAACQAAASSRSISVRDPAATATLAEQRAEAVAGAVAGAEPASAPADGMPGGSAAASGSAGSAAAASGSAAGGAPPIQ